MEFLIRLLAVIQLFAGARRSAAPVPPPVTPSQEEPNNQRWPGKGLRIFTAGGGVPGVLCVDGILRAEHRGGVVAAAPALWGTVFRVELNGQVRWGTSVDFGHAALGGLELLEQLERSQSLAEH